MNRTEQNIPLFERRHLNPMFTEYINLQYIHGNSICMKYNCIHLKTLTNKSVENTGVAFVKGADDRNKFFEK